MKYSRQIERGQSKLDIATREVKKGDIIEVYSPKLGELSWKYKKTEVHIVSAVNSNSVALEDGFNFSYAADEGVELIVRRPAEVTVQNVTIETHKTGSRGKAFIFRGCEVHLDGVVGLGRRGDDKKDDFLSCQSCVNSTFDNMKLSNYRYGLLINNSRNINVNAIHADDTNHAVAPSTWSTTVVVDGYTGKNTVTDGHMAINVTYKNVDIHCGKSYWNCRALGVVFENCKFTSDLKNPNSKIYIGVTGLTEEMEYLRHEYDITMRNVEWIHDSSGSNGLTISRCRDYKVVNCKTHLVSTQGFCSTITIDSSEVGSFKCYDSNFTITNTFFNGDLLSQDQKRSPIYCSYSGDARIVNSKFLNYKNVPLFGYIHSPKTLVGFESCTFGTFTNIAGVRGDKKKKYVGISFNNCILPDRSFLNDAAFISPSLKELRSNED